MSYCEYCQKLPLDNVHRQYHDEVYGRKISDDFELFGRLILEINQAGLSWDIILKKSDQFRIAFEGFDYTKISRYTEADVHRLLQNKGIIRHRLKIEATIYNAKQFLTLKEAHGSFFNWLEMQEIKNTRDWVKLFKKNFKFVGGEIVKEFLLSIGKMEGSHEETCPKYTPL